MERFQRHLQANGDLATSAKSHEAALQDDTTSARGMPEICAPAQI